MKRRKPVNSGAFISNGVSVKEGHLSKYIFSRSGRLTENGRLLRLLTLLENATMKANASTFVN